MGDVPLEDFLSLDLKTQNDLLPNQQKELARLQNELQELNKKDQEKQKEKEERKEEEKDDLQKAREILGEDIDLLDFIDLDIVSLDNLSEQKKKELVKLQELLKELHDADIKDAKSDIETRRNLESDEILKAGEILKNPDLALEEFIDMDLNQIKDIPKEK